jgi:ABC-2 type transport system permease protein
VSAGASHSADKDPTVLNVVRSEWTKLRSVRSTWWTILAYLVISLGLGALITWGNAADHRNNTPNESFDGIGIALAAPIRLGVLAIVVLGALTITSEYSTGGIRTSLTAVPNRLRFWAAKVLVFGALSLVLGLVGCVGTYLIAQPIYASYDITATLSQAGATRAVFGGAAYIALCGLFGMGLGFVIRNSPGAITAAIGLLLVVPLLSFLLPGDIGRDVARYFTSNAGAQISIVNQEDDDFLGPWAGFAVFAIWALVPLVGGAALLRRRDA